MVAFFHERALIPVGVFVESIFSVSLSKALHFGELLLGRVVLNDGVLIKISQFFLKVPALFWCVFIGLRNGLKGQLLLVGMIIG
jgi:hypothetical protein